MNHSGEQFNGRVITALALAVALAAGVSLAFKSTAATHDEAAHVRKILMQSAAGFERGDMAILNKVWTNDESESCRQMASTGA